MNDGPTSDPRARLVEALFDEGLSLPRDERRAFLDRISAEDAPLRVEVESLLAAFETDGDRVREILDRLPLAPGNLGLGGNERTGATGVWTGRRVGHYAILEKVGGGGMGVVYRAHDLLLERTVALKFLPAHLSGDGAAKQRFIREARAASALDHPTICTVFDVGATDEGDFYIAMPFYAGETLRHRIARGPLPQEEAVRCAMEIARGLEKAHAAGIVHRDIKPANVLLTSDGGLKILDFGIAKVAGRDLTQTGTRWGTVSYMSPEQICGEAVDHRTDLWSLGVVLYEMLTGRLPFRGAHAQARIFSILNEEPDPIRSLVPDVSPALQRIVRRALARSPDVRYASAGEMLADLRHLASGPGTMAPSRASRMRIGSAFRRRGVLLTAVAVVVLAAAVGIYTLYRNASSPPIASIAVLPLADLSLDSTQAYFAAGMHDALIDALAQIRPLRVTSRTSTLRYRDAERSVPEIARDLGVDGVVEGSVFRNGDSVSIQVRLIQAHPRERHLWTQHFSRPTTQALEIHRDVARAIAREIRLELSDDGAPRTAEVRRVNPQTYEAYLRGMYLLNQSTEEEFERGLQYLHDAVANDPADARAYVGLAYGYITYGHGPAAVDRDWSIARAAVNRALRLDSTLADAWAALADIKLYREWDWSGAEAAFRRANALNPNLAMNRYHHAWYLVLMGRTEEALAEHRRAQELDPLTPLHTVWVPGVYLWGGRFAEALDEARRVAIKYPDIGTAHFLLGAAAVELDEFDEAIKAHERAVEMSEHWRWALARTYALAGRTHDARQLLAELNAQPLTRWNAYGLAALHTALGDLDEAFRYLALRPAHLWLPWTRNDPAFAPLRNDPRFAAHLATMDLKP